MYSREMPKYRSHKTVHALKIEAITEREDGSALIRPVEDGYGPFNVDEEYVRKHEPKADGYYVVYSDGYESWSPAGAFEDGYTRID